jgi:hypothetical protein
MKNKFKILIFIFSIIQMVACESNIESFKDEIRGRYGTLNSMLDSVYLELDNNYHFSYYIIRDNTPIFKQEGEYHINKFDSRYSISVLIKPGYTMLGIGNSPNEEIGLSFYQSELLPNCLTLLGSDEYISPDLTFCKL